MTLRGIAAFLAVIFAVILSIKSGVELLGSRENPIAENFTVNFAKEAAKPVTEEPVENNTGSNCTLFVYNTTAVDFYLETSGGLFFLAEGKNVTLCLDTTPDNASICIDVDKDRLIDACYRVNRKEDFSYDIIYLKPTGYSTRNECRWYSLHVTPKDPRVTEFLRRLNLEENSFEMEKVFKAFRALLVLFNYTSDEILFGTDEYWEFPNETLTSGKGDCEDWATTFQSIVEALNLTGRCYVVTAEIDSNGHAFVMCRFPSGYYIFDQGTWRRRSTLEELIQSYLLLWKARNVTFEAAFNSTYCEWLSSTDELENLLK